MGHTYGPDPRVIDALREALGDPGIRQGALHSLVVVGQIDAVVNALDDPDDAVRAYAAACLGSLGFGEPSEIEALRRVMSDPNQPEQVRHAARTSLRKLGALKRGPAVNDKRRPTRADDPWTRLVLEVSSKRIADQDYAAGLDDEVIGSGWLGQPAASVADIQVVETRLGVKFPPSYRQFLLTTNGLDGLPASLWPVERVARLVDADPDSFALWSQYPSEVPDDAYSRYGEDQDPVQFRTIYLAHLIMAGPYEEFGCYLLNPQVVFNDGEWEAWNLNHDLPGANRYRSFFELVQAEAHLL